MTRCLNLRLNATDTAPMQSTADSFRSWLSMDEALVLDVALVGIYDAIGAPQSSDFQDSQLERFVATKRKMLHAEINSMQLTQGAYSCACRDSDH
jgi:hypothetical protein